MTTTQRWDRQDGETDKAFAAFCIYRDMGSERSYKDVRIKFGKQPNYERMLQRWGSQHRWVERATAYDAYLDEQKREALQEVQRKAQVEIVNNALSDYFLMRQAIDKRLADLEAVDWKATLQDLRELQDLMRKNDDMGRRAANLADKITATDLTSGGKPLPTWHEWVEHQLASDDAETSTD